jgi:hypothetical protein
MQLICWCWSRQSSFRRRRAVFARLGSDSVVVQNDAGGIVAGQRHPDMTNALATWSLAPQLDVRSVKREETGWLVAMHRRERVCCRLCGVQSRSRHGFSSRMLVDLSVEGISVKIRVRAGRRRCQNELCGLQGFAEPLSGLAGPSARRTGRLVEIVRLFGHSAGGRPSERLMVCLGMPISDSTMLPQVKHHARIAPKRAEMRIGGVRRLCRAGQTQAGRGDAPDSWP